MTDSSFPPSGHDSQQEIAELKNELARLKEQVATDRRTEEELRRSQKMLQLVMDYIPAGIFWKNRDSVYLGCNKLFAQAAGLRPEQIIGKVDDDLPWTREESDWYRKCDAQVMEQDKAWYHIIENQTNAQGVQTWVDTNKIPLHDDDDKVVGLLGTFEDITARVRMENELREKNATLEEQAAALQEAQRELLKINEELEERVRLRTLHIEEQNQKLSAALSELKTAQQQLIQAEKMVALGMLTAGIAHEIKNPLNFVSNFSQVTVELVAELKEELGEVPPQVAATLADIQSNLTRINEHGTRADSIVRAMLLHSRGDNVDQQHTGLTALLEQSIKIAYHGFRASNPEFNIVISTDFDPSIGKIPLVPHSLSRAYVNIVNNACYSIQQAQHRFPGRRPPELRVVSRKLAHAVEVRIRDNGLGIPQEKLTRVFEPFFTTKPPGEGTGLGLSICYDIIVKEHGGTMHIESTEGEYAEFITTLPYDPPQGGTV
jgi:PAS domain S-box-containing protein